MHPQNLLLIRHGAVDSPFSPQGPLIYGPEQPLNTKGKHQIIRLGQQFTNEHLLPSVIYTSPFLRAVQSAELLHETLPNHPPVIVRDNLAGAFAPQWNKRPESEAVGIDDLFADNPNVPDVHGETIEEVYARVVNEYDQIKSFHPQESVAIVTHFEIVGLLQHYLLHPTETPRLDHTVEKGECVFYQFSPEGTIIEALRISPEQFSVRAERRE